MIKKIIHLLHATVLFCLILFTVKLNAAPTTFYIATSGNDNYPGTLTQPFATIEKARAAVRSINSAMTDDIIINIRGGTYFLDSTFTLTSLDKASNGHSIIYQNYNCEKVIWSGGKKITGWTLHDAGKNIYKVNVGSVDSRQLYVNGIRATRARSVNATGWSESGTGYTCPSTVASWGNITDVEVVSLSYWKCHRGKIASVSGTHATMSDPYWTNLHAQYNAPPTWVENAYELLDAEGEWYLDRSTGILYYKPFSGEDINTAEVILPQLETLVKGSDLVNVQFKGITFAHATWLAPNSSYGFACVQAEALFTTPSLALNSFFQIPGNIAFDHCENMILENNTFEHLGVSALQLFRGCKNNRIINNIFQDVSGSGITVGSILDPNPSPTDSVKDNTIENNLITRVATEYFGCVGIFVAYTEHTIITHNEIRSLPYTGISAGWGWSNVVTVQKNNEIAYNRIDSIMTALIDGGGIYTLSAQPGAQVHDNYISHQFHEYGTLYPDEGSSYMHWHHNVVKNVIRWLHMWTSSIQNDTVDYNYYDNATQTLNGTACVVQNNTYVTGNNWPSAALAIMNNSGRPGVSEPPVQLNLSRNKSASASSFYDGTHTAAAGNDGIASTSWASNASETNPWWQVDLGSSLKLAKIILAARQDLDQAGTRTNFEIQASNSSTFSTFTTLGIKTGTDFPAFGSWSLKVTDTAAYRYVRVQRINNAGHFNFSELEIYDSTSVRQIAVQSVCVSPVALTLAVTDTARLNATITPYDASNKNVSWSSSNTAVASVNSSGLVTANDTGTAIITVTTIDGSKTATALVTVTATTGIIENENNSLSIFPNPSASNSMICYSLPYSAEVSIKVYDTMGKEVLFVTNERQLSGSKCVNLNNNKLDSGFYYIILDTREHQTIKKFVVSK